MHAEIQLQWWREKKEYRGHESLNDSMSAKGKMKMKLCCVHIQYIFVSYLECVLCTRTHHA